MCASDTLHDRRRRLLVVVPTWAFGLLLLLLLLGAGWGLFFRPSPAPVEKLNIALPTTPHAALLYIAAEKGYFAEEGLDVNVMPVTHGKAAVDLVIQGQADLGSAAEVPFVISVLKGAPLAIATSVVSVSNEMALIARRDRAIAAPRDLQGKKIGVTFGTSGEYYLWAFLIRNKLPPDSLAWVDVAPREMVRALASGEVDAISTWEPVKSKALAALGDNGLSFTDADAYTVTHVVVARHELLKTRPAAIEKLVRALLKAEAFNRTEPQRAMQLVADRLQLNLEALATSWKDISFEVDLRQSQLVTLEDEARWAMARGYADQAAMPNFLQHLHPDALLNVRAERVTVVR